MGDVILGGQRINSITPLAVSLGSDTDHIGNVGGDTVQVAAAFARPGDTTPYAIADAVADSTSAPTALSFAGCARANGGTGYITAVLLQKSTNAVTGAAFRVHFWNATPTLFNDNAAANLAWADRAKYVGYADLVLRTEGASADIAWALDDARRIPFTCAAADTALYATLAAEAAYTPGNAENFRVTVTVERN